MTGTYLDGSRWNPTLPTGTPTLVSTVELTEELRPLDAGAARWAYLLILAHGRPVGWITCPITNGRCVPTEIRRAITTTLAIPVLSTLVLQQLRMPINQGSLCPHDLFVSNSQHSSCPSLPITVAVCTKDRPIELERCLRSISRLDYANFDVIVVDNASTSKETEELLATEFPEFRYVRENRVGLDWARNHALSIATGSVIAYTDDDTVVDKSWLSKIARVFEEDDVGAVTGLIAPLELRYECQLSFEVIGGFGRGCRKSWHRIDPNCVSPDTYHLGAGRFGAGANMAFRKTILNEIGGFDPSLDVGTPTEGGGDIESFFRCLHEGYTLVYEPAAIVWHGHRASSEALTAQINTWGTAMGAFLASAFLRYPAFRVKILNFAVWWSWFGYIGPALRSLTGPGRLPRKLRFGPIRRLPLGPLRFLISRNKARMLGATFQNRPLNSYSGLNVAEVGLFNIDLAEGIASLSEAAEYQSTNIYVNFDKTFIGTITIHNRKHPISASELRSKVADDLVEDILSLGLNFKSLVSLQDLGSIIHAQLKCPNSEYDEAKVGLVSIVVATYNRPVQLRRCLESLVSQITYFPYEIVVVDNAPGIGHVEEIVGNFECARYIEEPIQGLAMARNTGFRAARGEILVATDDDIVAPSNWLKEIVQPFRFAHIGVSTGRVVPLSLKHQAQRDFEKLGGLDKGPISFEVGIDWLSLSLLYPPRVWDLGATANAAFRRSLLEDPRVGLLLESLGPGTPAGGGEDAYLFYRVLAAGYGIYYESSAMLFHEHRKSEQELKRQIFNYARGHVAYLLTTLVNDLDIRVFFRLIVILPFWHLWRLFRGPSGGYRRSVVLFELIGYFLGYWGWIRGRYRHRKLLKSGRLFVPLSSIDSEILNPIKDFVSSSEKCG